MKKSFFVFLLILSISSLVYAVNYDVVFSGKVEGRNIEAISVDRIYKEQALDELINRLNGKNVKALVYKDYRRYSSLEPLAVYIDKLRESYNPKFKSSTSYPTVQNNINSSEERKNRKDD